MIKVVVPQPRPIVVSDLIVWEWLWIGGQRLPLNQPING